jgi:hypothetical protein
MSIGSRFAHFAMGTPNAANLTTQLADTSRTHNYATTYIQAMAGVKTKITTPYIMNLIKNGPISINKAELVVKVDASTLKDNGNTYTPPASVLLFGINDDGTSYVLSDLIQAPYYYYGGYNAGTIEYTLNISRYIQQLLDKRHSNNGLYLLVPHVAGATTASRAVVGGGAPLNADGSPNTYQMKLNITYTKIH